MSEVSPDFGGRILQAAQLIQSATNRVVLSGAGISTPSGIPDFRSTGSGLWTRFDPFEVASLRAFRYRPEKFFAWMRSLAQEIVAAIPNAAHHALARLEEAGFVQTIITQNIDGLHHRAGSRHVLEVHGSLKTLTCVGCYRQFASDGFLGPYLESGQIPRCPDCQNILKPDIVLFEEQLPLHTWQQASRACNNCDLMIVVGSSLEVMPVAGLPMQAIQNGARLIITNQSPTYVDIRADVVLRGDVAEVLPRITSEVICE